MKEINIYCDESGHFNTKEGTMTLDAICCDKNKKTLFFEYLKEIKERHNFNHELKWSKVSIKYFEYYKDVIDYFMISNLKFSSVIVLKNELKHDEYNQTHDQLYYKIFYLLIKYIMSVKGLTIYNVFCDKKDSHTTNNLRNTTNYLYDLIDHEKYFNQVRSVDSKSVELVQLADFLSGMIAFIYNRDYLNKTYESKGKNDVSDYFLLKTNLLLKRNQPFYDYNLNVMVFPLLRGERP